VPNYVNLIKEYALACDSGFPIPVKIDAPNVDGSPIHYDFKVVPLSDWLCFNLEDIYHACFDD
jgi:hypothetical protein